MGALCWMRGTPLTRNRRAERSPFPQITAARPFLVRSRRYPGLVRRRAVVGLVSSENASKREKRKIQNATWNTREDGTFSFLFLCGAMRSRRLRRFYSAPIDDAGEETCPSERTLTSLFLHCGSCRRSRSRMLVRLYMEQQRGFDFALVD